ncbi:MAG: methenyltetrahydromethanopterin cyclohydrolase, partial [bacterium]
MNQGFSLNDQAAKIVDLMISKSALLGLKAKKLENGSWVLDATLGGYQAGKLLSEACMGGLGSVSFTSLQFSSLSFPGVSVSVEQPHLACLASQYAGWSIKVDKFFALGSGPARALARVEKLFEELAYT